MAKHSLSSAQPNIVEFIQALLPRAAKTLAFCEQFVGPARRSGLSVFAFVCSPRAARTLALFKFIFWGTPRRSGLIKMFFGRFVFLPGPPGL